MRCHHACRAFTALLPFAAAMLLMGSTFCRISRAAEEDAAATASGTAAADQEDSADDDSSDEGEDAADSSEGESEGGGSLGRIFGGLFGGGESEEEGELSPLVGEPAPDFELQTPGGDTLALADLRGQTVVLDFWATWCGPCKAAMPQLQSLHEELGDEKVTILGVNQRESTDTINEFLEEEKFTFPQVLDADGAVGDAFLVSGIPQTVVIDPNGVVQQVHVGYSPTLGSSLAASIKSIQRGENVFDEAKVAAARAKRLEEVAKLKQKIGPVHPELWETVGAVSAPLPIALEASNPEAWITLPGSGGRALAGAAGGDQVMLLTEDGDEAEVAELQWRSSLKTWKVFPGASGDELIWTAVGYGYDDNDEVELHLAQFDRGGKRLWSEKLPLVSSDFSVAVGDLTGDGAAEVTLLASYSETDFGPDDRDVSRVLTTWDAKGNLLSRQWVHGSGGVGLYVVPADGGSALLLNTGEGLARMRLTSPGN